MTKKERTRRKAEDLAYSGWDALGASDSISGKEVQAAEKFFREALIVDPDLADAFNGLGNVLERSERLAEAEAMYRTALEKARVELGTDMVRAHSWWGDVRTRPYMRARHNLGLVFWRQGKYGEAIDEFKQVLRRNPHDNQGIRYLIGGVYHLWGKLQNAISFYNSAGAMRWGGLDAQSEFNYGLALFQTHSYPSAVLQFRSAFFSNLYLPTLVLSGDFKRMNIWHGTNLAEPQYAVDYWETYAKLWAKRPSALRFLRSVHEDETVHADLKSFVAIRGSLLGEQDIKIRSSLVDEELRLTSRQRLEATNPEIISRVLSNYRAIN